MSESASLKGEVCLRVRSEASLVLHMTLRHNKEGTVRFIFEKLCLWIV